MKYLILLVFLVACSYNPNDRFVDKRAEAEHNMDINSVQMAYAGFLEGYMVRWSFETKEISSTNQELWNLYDVVLPALLRRLDVSNANPEDYLSFKEIFEKQCLSGKYIKITGPEKRPSIMLPFRPIKNTNTIRV